jgi:tetratricopeptide (TPR) repeat protein
VNYGYILNDFGRFEEAQKVADHMSSIDDNSFLTYSLLAGIRFNQGKIGEAAYYLRKATEVNPRLNAKFNMAFTLETLGLSDMAAETMANSGFEVYGLFFKKNNELFTSQVRATFPRSENDASGAFTRGATELWAGNYKQAVKFLEQSFCTNCNFLIYSYQQIGDTESANKLLDERKTDYESRIMDGELYLDGEAMNLAYLSGNIDKAIEHLLISTKNGFIPGKGLRENPIFKKLREHPQWPEILANADKRMAAQRDTYLKLVAGEV